MPVLRVVSTAPNNLKVPVDTPILTLALFLIPEVDNPEICTDSLWVKLWGEVVWPTICPEKSPKLNSVFRCSV